MLTLMYNMPKYSWQLQKCTQHLVYEIDPFISPPHRGQINGSTSKTFLIISAQPFDGTNETSSSIIGGWEGSSPIDKIAQELQHKTGAVNIEVPVRVFKGGTFIDNLTIEDFEVYEDGFLQNIAGCFW
jgi:hypothetical protein